MTFPIAQRELGDRARGLVGWLAGFTFFISITIATYPSIRDQPGIEAFEREIPEVLRAFTGGEEFDFSSAEGLFNSRMFAFLLPLLVLIWAIGFGARTVAGEHEEGRLDLVLSYPVTRTRLLIEKLVVLVGVVAGFGLVIYDALIIGGFTVDLGLRPGNTAAACLMLVALGALFGVLAVAVGAHTLQRSLAYAVAGGYAAFAYFLNSLSALASWLEPLRPLSAFYWYGRQNPLSEGLDIVGLAVLLTGIVVATAISFVVFERRDLA
jgi:ABC-2 type transport system permease protein